MVFFAVRRAGLLRTYPPAAADGPSLLLSCGSVVSPPFFSGACTHTHTFFLTRTHFLYPVCLHTRRYIRDLATLVVAYGISINLVEVTWKSKIKAQFPNPNDYSAFMGDFSTATGFVTFTMMILSRYIFRYFGWGTAALITPVVLLITGIAFFSLVLFR